MWYQRNLEILDLYMDPDQGLEEHIEEVRPLIGDPGRRFW